MGGYDLRIFFFEGCYGWMWGCGVVLDLELEFGIVAPGGPGAIAAIAVISMLRLCKC